MAATEPNVKPAAASNLTLRIASAIVLMPLAFGTAYYGDWPFALFWAIAAIAVLVGMDHAGRRSRPAGHVFDLR